jgi:hypothetical protein
MRRIKFKKQYQGPVAQIQQIRVSPSDMANTILKMAKKRALIDAVLTATGASDIFSQDIEDLPEGFIPPESAPVTMAEVVKPTPVAPVAPVQTPEEEAEAMWRGEEPNSPTTTTTVKSGPVISDPQRKRLFAIAMGAGMTKERLNELVTSRGYASSKDILKSDYEDICKAAETYNPIQEC